MNVRRIKSLRRKLLVAGASVVLAGAAAELVARAWGPREWRAGWIPNLTWADLGVREPLRGWALRPGIRARVVGPHAAYDVETKILFYFILVIFYL
jgi:hypothetical protein